MKSVIMNNENIMGILLLPIGKTKPKKRYNGNDAFGILGISPKASMRQVKRAYRDLVSQYHPDINHSHNAKEQFIKINKAYSFIVKGGDLARYIALCDISQSKQKFAEVLMTVKRVIALTGNEELEIPRPPTNRIGISDDEWEQQQRLLTGLLFRCPLCKWKDGCDVATGFSEVKDIYNRMVKKSMEMYFGGNKNPNKQKKVS